MSSSSVVPVTLAEIARLAGVGRAAVSNWRRRHTSFPERIGGTDVSPQFSMAEIEAWLRENGKINKSAEREWLWPQFEALGGRDRTGCAIREVGRQLTGQEAGGGEFSDEARRLIERAVELGRRDGGAETFEFLLRRWLDVHIRQIATTPEPLAALMAELALRTATEPRGDGDGVTVMDPACGTGHLLAAVAGGAGPDRRRPRSRPCWTDRRTPTARTRGACRGSAADRCTTGRLPAH